jgi:hypothetical protein
MSIDCAKHIHIHNKNVARKRHPAGKSVSRLLLTCGCLSIFRTEKKYGVLMFTLFRASKQLVLFEKDEKAVVIRDLQRSQSREGAELGRNCAPEVSIKQVPDQSENHIHSTKRCLVKIHTRLSHTNKYHE